MSRPKASNKQLRDAQRIVHLVGGVMLAVYVYAPLIGGSTPAFAATLMQFVVFPTVVATGLLMWQLPRLRRLLKTRQGGKEDRVTPGPMARS